MRICLRVTAYQDEPPQEPIVAEFDAAGGTIGRATSNDLVLPDPKRLVSRLHARVLRAEDGFVLHDHGNNACVVNGQPVGCGRSLPIGDGDVLHIGEFRLLAEVKFAPAISLVPDIEPAQQSAAASREAGADGLAQALLKGLGMTRLDLPDGLTPELMERVGALLREATQGTLELLQARAAIKREVRADATLIAGRGNNPLKFAADASAALAMLLAPARGTGRGFVNPVEAMHDAYKDLRAHEFAVLAGMRETLASVLRVFDPRALERRLAPPSLLDRLLPLRRRARLWQQHLEAHRQVLEAGDDDLHGPFDGEFAAAYEAHAARLSSD